VLFNTLAYAKFFAIVFVVSWLLVRLRLSLLLPWCASAAYALLHDWSALALGGSALTLLLTYGLIAVRPGAREAGNHPPGGFDALLSVVLNLGFLTWLTYRAGGTDPVTWALRALGVPLPTTGVFSVVVVLGAAAALLAVMRARKARLLFLVGASYVFYAHWDWRFLPLIFASSTIDWWLGRLIGNQPNPVKRKRLLIVTVIVNLGALGFFKYFNFSVDTARGIADWAENYPTIAPLVSTVHLGSSQLLAPFGVSPADLVQTNIALPIGISFFTFESMSYVIDVYRGHLKPHQSYFEYLGFVAFFPHLVAGPIVRPRDLLPQLGESPRWNSAEGSEGLFLIAVGLIKKVAIGDYLALNLIDRVFDAPTQYSSLECYSAVVSYAVQIYCDFSGYTDVAIGCALLLGVRFPLNFDAPYKADSIQDFWRRWHISLSTWLRDYLYIPLGGNRRGGGRTYFNLMTTMLLGGLWHGASWTFVVWGGMHGLALAVTRALGGSKALPPEGPYDWFVRSLKVLVTFHFVCLTWIFFRSPTFAQAWTILRQLSLGSFHATNLHVPVVVCLGVGLLSHFVPERWYQAAQRGFIRAPFVVQGVLLFAAAWVLRELASADAVPFVYFQF